MNEMKRQITLSLMIAAATVLLLLPRSTVTAQVQDKAAAAALKAAMDKETLEGNPKSAIEQYKKIAESKDRSVAAQALMHMAEAYRKFGDVESRRIYERIVKDYADQKEPFALAQARLGDMGQSTGPVSRTLWTTRWSPGESSWGTLSPDGRFFSYSRRDLFLHEIATGMDRNLTNRPKDSKESASESVISRDGKRIAYISYNSETSRYSLLLASLSGDPNPKKLYDNPDIYDIYLDDWSMDGKWLAVEVHHIDKTVQIGLVSVSDGSLRVLRSIDWLGNRGVQGMYFSPDSKYLGYDLPRGKTGQEHDVYVLAIDGSSQIPVVEQSGDSQMVGWSPDGKWLLFKSDHAAAGVDLFAVAFTVGKPQGMPQRLRGNVGASFFPFGWAASGALYYRTQSGSGIGGSRLQLASLDFTTGNLVSTPISSTRGYQENTISPAWSPDGMRLAYISYLRDRTGYEILVRAIDTGTIRELRPKQLSIISSIRAWTPEGRSLLVLATDLQDRSGIYRVDTETGDSSAVVMNQTDTSFTSGDIAWMPGGLFFLTTAKGSKAGLYRVDMQTGDISALVLDPSLPNPLFPSSNGKTFYYRRAFPATNEVAFIERDLATGKERELIRRTFLGQVNLSPDGRYSATASTDTASNSRVLLLIPTAGGPPRELLSLPVDVKSEDLGKANVGPWVGVLSWASDNRSALLVKTFNDPKKDNELWFVSMDGRELSGKIRVPPNVRLSPSPDNRYAVYTIAEPAPPATTEVSVLENFLPKTAPAIKK